MSDLRLGNIKGIISAFDELGYVADEELATLLFLMEKLGKPLLIEGHPGVGKTDVSNILSGLIDTDLIRLQCYEGLDINSAVYEWNYQKQLLGIKIQEGSPLSAEEKEHHIFGDDFLLKRPLLQSITSDKKVVLLIDEIDRADEEFEAFLLELLSEFQISIPEMGTIKAKVKPYVILTSNRTRELSDALKRRCLYLWIDYPDYEKELRIVSKKLPGIESALASRIVNFVQGLRKLKLSKKPGIAETIDWAIALTSVGAEDVEKSNVRRTIGSLLKSHEDIKLLSDERIEELIVS